MIDQAGRLAERLYRVFLPETKKAVYAVDDWAALGTLAGSVRPQNQDRLFGGQFSSIDGKVFRLVALSDGMGGLKNGQEAAALTLASLLWYMTSSNGQIDRRLQEATNYANEQVTRQFDGEAGATLSAVVVTSTGDICAVNVGDSRIYGYRKVGGLRQISVDDTLAGLADKGMKIDVRHNPTALLQHVGMGVGLEPHIFKHFDGEGGFDYFLLTSDGVHWVGHQFLSLIADNADDSTQLTRRLLSLAEMTGAHDNASLGTIRPLRFAESVNSVPEDVIDMELWTPQARTLLMSERRNSGRVAQGRAATSTPPPPVPPAGDLLRDPLDPTSEPAAQAREAPRAEDYRFAPQGSSAVPKQEVSPERATKRRPTKNARQRGKKKSPDRLLVERPELFIEFGARSERDD